MHPLPSLSPRKRLQYAFHPAGSALDIVNLGPTFCPIFLINQHLSKKIRKYNSCECNFSTGIIPNASEGGDFKQY